MAQADLPSGVDVGRLDRRLVAQLIDGIVPLLLGLVFALVVNLSRKPESILVASIAVTVALAAYALLVWWMFASRSAGPGMRIMKLQLVGLTDGKPIGWGRFFLRQLILGACAATVVGLVFLVVVLVMNPMRQGWHDLAVRSVVIAERAKVRVSARPVTVRKPVTSTSVSATVGLPPHLSRLEGFSGQRASWDSLAEAAFADETSDPIGIRTTVPGISAPSGPYTPAQPPAAQPPSWPGPQSVAPQQIQSQPSGQLPAQPQPVGSQQQFPYGAQPVHVPAQQAPAQPVLYPQQAPAPYVQQPPAQQPAPNVQQPPVGLPVQQPAAQQPAPYVQHPPVGLPVQQPAAQQPAPYVQQVPAQPPVQSPAQQPTRSVQQPPVGLPVQQPPAQPEAPESLVRPAEWNAVGKPPPAAASSPGAPTSAAAAQQPLVPSNTTLPDEDDYEGTHLARPPGGWSIRMDDGREFAVTGTILVGRNPSPKTNEIVAELVSSGADGRMVSKTHLAVGIDQRGVFVMDRGSTNGTAIASGSGGLEPCAAGDRVRVRDGQIVSFGDHSLVIRRTPD